MDEEKGLERLVDLPSAGQQWCWPWYPALSNWLWFKNWLIWQGPSYYHSNVLENCSYHGCLWWSTVVPWESETVCGPFAPELRTAGCLLSSFAFSPSMWGPPWPLRSLHLLIASVCALLVLISALFSHAFSPPQFYLIRSRVWGFFTGSRFMTSMDFFGVDGKMLDE